MHRYNKKTNELHYDYYFYHDSPGYPPTLPPRGPLVTFPYTHLSVGPRVTPATRASAEMFTPQGLQGRVHTCHNGAALKDEKSPDGKDRTALFGKTDTVHLPPFPPNNVTRPASRTRFPPPNDSGLLLPFPPNNVTRPAARSKSPPPKATGPLPHSPPNDATRTEPRSKTPPPNDSDTLPPFPPNNDTRLATCTRSPPPKDFGPLPSFLPNNVTCPMVLTRSPPSKDSGPLSPFSPYNVTRPEARSRSPSPTRKAPKKAADDQGCLQRNEMGEGYYVNTTTFDWQIETPDCLKKNKTL